MKKALVVLTAVTLSLVFTWAFAGELVTMANKDLGVLFYEDAPGPMIKEARVAGTAPIDEIGKDVGVVLYESHLAMERDLAASKGVAAGGLGAEKAVDERTLIWDRLLKPGPYPF
jgi:hypothetical protein